jgi:hypothetical protein
MFSVLILCFCFTDLIIAGQIIVSINCKKNYNADPLWFQVEQPSVTGLPTERT